MVPPHKNLRKIFPGLGCSSIEYLPFPSFVSKTIISWHAGEKAQWLRALLFLQRTRVQFLEPTWVNKIPENLTPSLVSTGIMHAHGAWKQMKTKHPYIGNKQDFKKVAETFAELFATEMHYYYYIFRKKTRHSPQNYFSPLG